MFKKLTMWFTWSGIIVKAMLAKDGNKSLSDSMEKLSTEEMLDLTLFNLDSLLKKYKDWDYEKLFIGDVARF